MGKKTQGKIPRTIVLQVNFCEKPYNAELKNMFSRQDNARNIMKISAWRPDGY